MAASSWPLRLAFVSTILYSSNVRSQDSPRPGDIPGSESVSIEIGMLSAGGDARHNLAIFGTGAEAYQGGAWIREEIESFSASRPDIRVTEINLERPRRADQPLAEALELPKNIIGIDTFAGDEIPYLIQRELIVPIDKFLPDPEFNADVFHENLWDSVRFREKVWAVPWATDPLVLVCNWPLFEAAGLDRPPTTWDEFLEYAKKMTLDTDGDGKIDQWGYGVTDPNSVGVSIGSMILQNGGHLMDADGFELSHPAIREVLGFGKELARLRLYKVDITGSWSNRCGMRLVSPNRLNLVPNTDRFLLAYPPTFGEKKTLSYGRLYLAIRKASPEEERASWELLKWLSRRDTSMPTAWGGYPARKDFIQREDFRSRQESGLQNLEILYEASAWSIEPGPYFSGRGKALLRVLQILYTATSAIGPENVEKIISRAEDEGNKLIRAIDPSRSESYEIFK